MCVFVGTMKMSTFTFNVYTHKGVPDVFPLYTSAFPEMCVCDAKAYKLHGGQLYDMW